MDAVTVRVGTTAEWADTDATDGAAASVLELGELGLDTDKGQIKVGDGTTAFPSLPTAFRQNRVGTAAALVSGTKVIADARVTANSIILLTLKTLGTITAPKAVEVTARTPGTSFTITSADNTDTSVYQYVIIEP